MDALTGKGGLLYPMLVIAAIAVIVFSVTGIATMMGWLPSALSGRDATPGFQQSAPAPRNDANDQRAGAPRETTSRLATPAPAVCGNCGVVELIRAVEGRGSSTAAVGGAERRASAAP